MDVYKRGVGVIKKFQPVNTVSEAEQALEKYCQENNVQVVFKKANGQIHAFNHPSFEAMERMVKQLQCGDWEAINRDHVGVRQLLKALYWIPEEDRKDHGGFGFGQLISCLEKFTFDCQS